MVKSLGGSDALDKTAVDDELVSLVPAWFGSVGRFESDALVASSAFPSVDIGYDGHNKKSTLLGWAPPDTIAYGEVHDVGAAIDRAARPLPRSCPRASRSSTRSTRRSRDRRLQRDLRLVGRHGARRLGGRRRQARRRPRHPAPTDAAAAKTAADTLRGLLAIGGGQAGIKLRRRPARRRDDHRRRLQRRPRRRRPTFPAGYKPELGVHVHRPGRRHRLRPVVRRERPRRRARPVARATTRACRRS